MKDNRELSDYEQGRLEICIQLALKSLAQKEVRKDYSDKGANQADMVAASLESDNSENLYQFSCYIYEEDGKISGPHQFLFPLSDEEYIFLLSHLLFEPQGFTYNTLYKYSVDFLEKLNNAVNSHFSEIPILTFPFLVIFDEIIDDAKQFEDERNQLMIDFFMNDIIDDDEMENEELQGKFDDINFDFWKQRNN